MPIELGRYCPVESQVVGRNIVFDTIDYSHDSFFIMIYKTFKVLSKKQAEKYTRFLNKKYGYKTNEGYEDSSRSFFIEHGLIIMNNYYSGCGCGCGAGYTNNNKVIGRIKTTVQ